jgi:hypothetical protein
MFGRNGETDGTYRQMLIPAFRSAEFKDLKCMNFTSKGTREILVAGCQERMFKVDVEKGLITDTVCLHFVAIIPY